MCTCVYIYMCVSTYVHGDIYTHAHTCAYSGGQRGWAAIENVPVGAGGKETLAPGWQKA